MKQEVIHPHHPVDRPPPRILLVEDSLPERGMLSEALSQWGYWVREAASAEEALAITATESFDIILSDWVMPGLSGPELCRLLRQRPEASYAYFILITGKSEKSDVAHGLESGADDLLSKPVTFAELHARLRAGERLLQVQRELEVKNHLLSTTLDELRKVHDSLDRDLAEARRIQQSQAQNHEKDLGTASISLMLHPSGHIGGDLAGYLRMPNNRLGFYSIDVSGHGIASALMAARLAGVLSTVERTLNHNPDPLTDLPPEVFVGNLNRMLLREGSLEQYCTCVFGDIDLGTGRVRFTQAGHPHPLLVAKGKPARSLGQGGLPVGLIHDAEWNRVELDLQKGESLLVLTDGLIESQDDQSRPLGAEGVKRLLETHQDLKGFALLDTLARQALTYSKTPLHDDISGILIDWRGSEE